ncbi:metallophosphoesterase family protein [Paenibacillus vulneris]|uniref:Metallophosphoesterase family protein n=1 Tax=Paenibacillus vulneris TaxID=1133364 RepID=A0ABW3UW66_9BACL|nr:MULTISPECIES: metallophosphoesterase family protein [unclassified Paenibacillus]MBE1443555.1 protein phosphatase [Paenibacillus sp. OAS669]
MQKIAVISDIHGNIPALDAVLEDIRQRGVTAIYCLGDLVGTGPHPAEAVDTIKELCPVVVMGNWDHLLTKPSQDEVLQWHQRRLGEERLRWLGQLPFSHDFMMSGKKIRLFHASPVSVYTRIQPWDSMESRLTMFHNTDQTGGTDGSELPDVVGYGDIHNAYSQNLRGRTLFNAGSVGNPLDIPQASYAILEGQLDSSVPSAFSIQLVRVPYDIELAVRLAEQADIPLLEPYSRELRTGRYRGLKE